MERNVTFDYLKIILSMLVITIHMPPLFSADSIIGWSISNGIARIAVPIFFMLNGYYMESKLTNFNTVWKYIKRFIVLYIVWMLIYLPFFCGMPIRHQLVNLLTGYFHLWYLPALIIGTALLFLFRKTIKYNYVILAIALILYFTGLYIQNNYYGIQTENIRQVLFRNGFFMGFPFIFLGWFIKENQEKIKRINPVVLILAGLVLIAVFLWEIFSKYTENSCNTNLYIAIIFLCPIIFTVVLNQSKYSENDGYIGKLASGIFFIHIWVVVLITDALQVNEMKIFIYPVVLFFSALLSVVLIQLNKRIKIFL